tara:strand:+ start:5746 stop:7536 length:1791 start_codon:yes stop_codon:yes gene_type:complete
MLKKAKAIYYHSEFSSEKIQALKNILSESQIKNIPKDDNSLLRFASFLPAGTIVAQSLDIGEDKILCLPVLSSNISLPVKQGEYIWYFFDDTKVDEIAVKTRPLIMIRHYWLSRIHGTLVSEDLNYTYKERDATVLNKPIPEDSPLASNVNLPNFEDQKFMEFNLKEAQKSITTKKLYEEGITKKSFVPKATPRYFSKTDDLTLQGSYNTLINFSRTNDESSHNKSPEGSISIVAGRLALQDFKFENSQEKPMPTVLFRNITNTGKEEQFIIDDKNYKIIDNALEKEELLKRPDFYLNFNPKTFENKESLTSFDKDASILLVNESLEVDNKKYYNVDLIEDFHNSYENLFNGLLIEYPYEVQTLNQKGKLTSVPTILAKTNNIRLIARKKLETEEKVDLPEGSIRLIKESNNILDYSHINMESNGCIDMSGSLIKVGNFLSEYIKHAPESDDIDNFAEYDNKIIDSMRGQGSGVVLGYDKNYSESLVLGQTLKGLLEEILATNIEFVKELKKISAALKTHTHNNSLQIVSTVPLIGPNGPIPPGSPIGNGVAPSLVPTDPSVYIAYESSGSTDLEKDYNNINGRLINILSKFAKTT